MLRFKRGTALTPLEGFSNGFKPLQGPVRVRLLVSARDEDVGLASEMVERLLGGCGFYEGFEEWFGCDVEVGYAGLSDDYARVDGDVEGWDVVLAFIPDKLMVPYDLDPYLPLKRSLASMGIPSQMVESSTFRLADNPYVLFNLSLSLYCKAGGVPWGLAEPLGADFVIGLDVSGGYAAYTVIWRWDEVGVDWGAFRCEGETIRGVGRIVEEVARRFGGDRVSFVIHRDGLPGPGEAESVDDVYRRLRVDMSGLGYAYVSVRKRFPPRIFSLGESGFEPASKGAFVVFSHEKGVICTAGYPEFRGVYGAGSVRPMLVEVVETSNWNFRIEEFLRHVFWLSELHWASGLRSTKYPISTLYAHRIARFASVGVLPEDIGNSLWFL